MVPRRVRLFALLGSGVWLDFTVLPLAAVGYWTCREHVFPSLVPGLAVDTYGWMAAAGTAGLFLSVLVRELVHVLVGRRLGLSLPEVAWFPFAGVLLHRAVPGPLSRELLLLAAGSAANALLAGLLLLVLFQTVEPDTPLAVAGVAFFLGMANLLLLAVNAVPVYPLAGGRVAAAMLARRRAPEAAAGIVAGAGSMLSAGLVLAGAAMLALGGLLWGGGITVLGIALHGGARRRSPAGGGSKRRP